MLGSANVVIKGPRVGNADIRTHLDSSDKRLAYTGANTVLRVSKQHAHDTDIITSAHAFRTPQTLSRQSSTNFGS